jgi:hypothetical protein
MYRFGVRVRVRVLSLFVTITFLARSVGAAADHVVRHSAVRLLLPARWVLLLHQLLHAR